MAKLQLSERFRRAFAKLRTADDATFDAVVAALSTASRQDVEQIARLLPNEVEDREDVVNAVLALYHTRVDAAVTTEKLVDDLIESLPAEGDVSLPVDRFRERVTRILTIDSLGLVTKSARVLTDYERALYDVNILSDLRPVFGDDPTIGPVGMGIVHILELFFHKNGREHEKFYVALDTADLDKLRQTAERAQKKAAALRHILTESGVRYLEGES